MTRRRRLRKLTPAEPSGPALLELGDLADLVLHLEVPLGTSELSMSELQDLGVGSVLELDRLTGEPVEITVNGTPIARAEIRVHGERFAVRITEILGTPKLDTREMKPLV